MQKKTQTRCITIKLLKMKDKEKNLGQGQKNQYIHM